MSNLDAPVITRYFEADARRDIDAIVALFTDEAVVVDEGQTYHGSAQIRGWQEGAASRYRYTTEVFDIQRTGEESYLVTGRLTGNFPGGTAELKWRFTVHGDLISHSEQYGLL
jgi:ketosteroid isomerase-like protein